MNKFHLWILVLAIPTLSGCSCNGSRTPLHVLHGHAGRIPALALSGSSQRCVSTSHDGTAHVWDLSVENPSDSAIVIRTAGWPLALDRNGRQLAVAGRRAKNVAVWNLESQDANASPLTLQGHELLVHSLAMRADGKQLVSGGSNSVRVWDLTSDDPSSSAIVLRGHQGGVNTVAISSDGRRVVSGGVDKSVCVWHLKDNDPNSSNMRFKGHTRQVTIVRVSDDGTRIASAGLDNVYRVWKVTEDHTVEFQAVFDTGRKELAHVGMELSRDGRWLAALAKSDAVVVWDLEADDPRLTARELRGHEDDVVSLAMDESGKLVSSADASGNICIWNLSASRLDEPVEVLEGQGLVFHMALSEDGKWLATAASDHTLKIWDLSDLTE